MIMIYYEKKGYKNRWHIAEENQGDKTEKNGLIGERKSGAETVI